MIDNAASRPDADLGRLIEALAAQAEASRRVLESIESRALPLLERIALALERSPGAIATAEARVAPEGGISGLRRAIDEARWEEARAIADGLADDRPDDPEVARLVAELDRSRQFAVDDLRQRIEAARQANDPEGAIASRDELAAILRGGAIADLDRSLVRWLMVLIQRRLRTGTIRADLVGLAARVAESFGGTTEGASLRASLPTLRRSAGLCPRCAEPYAGVGDACPKCLAATEAPTPAGPFEGGPDDIEDDPDPGILGEPVDLNNERLWQEP